MRNFLIRAILNAIAITIAAYVLPGIAVTDDFIPLFIVGAIITLANALIKPILTLLTCPFVILTLGLFIFVINGAILAVAAEFSGNALVISSFWDAVFAGIIMAVVNLVLESVFGIREEGAKGKKG